jgi:toxin ParE1/3/4
MSERRFTVVWTEIAAADVERLAGYLVDESPLRAEAVLDRIITRAESLDRSPERGRAPRELRSIGDRTWRDLQEPPWRILYRIVGTTVEIHGVLDGRRDLGDILLERLLQG